MINFVLWLNPKRIIVLSLDHIVVIDWIKSKLLFDIFKYSVFCDIFNSNPCIIIHILLPRSSQYTALTCIQTFLTFFIYLFLTQECILGSILSILDTHYQTDTPLTSLSLWRYSDDDVSTTASDGWHYYYYNHELWKSWKWDWRGRWCARVFLFMNRASLWLAVVVVLFKTECSLCTSVGYQTLLYSFS